MNAESHANALLRQVWRDLQQASNERQLAEIQANPEKHRLTRLMAKGASTNYRYRDAGEKQTGRKRECTRYCVTVHRNAAGVFLIWRQVDRYKRKRGKWDWYETERFDFQWAPTKREAWEIVGRKVSRNRAAKLQEGIRAMAAEGSCESPQA